MNLYAPIPEWLYHAVFPILRWLHVLTAGLLVGGTLFYEFVIPAAVEDLRTEQQMAIFGRVKWMFNRVVWFCAIILIVSGIASAWRLTDAYFPTNPATGARGQSMAMPWALVHVILAVITLVLALRLTHGRSVPPMGWMRVNLVLLLTAMFLSSAARHVRLTIQEKQEYQTQRELKQQGSFMLRKARDSSTSEPTSEAMPSTLPGTGAATSQPAAP